MGTDDVDVEVVAERARRGKRQARHHGEDGRERDRGDEGKEELSSSSAEEAVAEILGQPRSGQVAVRRALWRDRRADLGLADQRRRAEPQEGGHDVEGPDQAHRPRHRLARGLGVGHREKAHQDVREARRAEDQGHAERDILEQGLVDAPDLRLAVRVEDSRLGEVEPALRVLDTGDRVEEGSEVESEMEHDQKAEQDGAAHEENRLDDLDPGGGNHSAGDDVDHHQHADQRDRRVELGAEHRPVEPGFQRGVERRDQDLDQASGADHLGHHV